MCVGACVCVCVCVRASVCKRLICSSETGLKSFHISVKNSQDAHRSHCKMQVTPLELAKILLVLQLNKTPQAGFTSVFILTTNLHLSLHRRDERQVPEERHVLQPRPLRQDVHPAGQEVELPAPGAPRPGNEVLGSAKHDASCVEQPGTDRLRFRCTLQRYFLQIHFFVLHYK